MTDVPTSSVFNAKEMSCTLTPNARARSWSISSRTAFAISCQSETDIGNIGVSARRSRPFLLAARRSVAGPSGNAGTARGSDRRAILEAQDARRTSLHSPLSAAKAAFLQALFEILAGLDPMGRDDQLRKIVEEQLQVERQIETGLRADVARRVFDRARHRLVPAIMVSTRFVTASAAFSEACGSQRSNQQFWADSTPGKLLRTPPLKATSARTKAPASHR